MSATKEQIDASARLFEKFTGHRGEVLGSMPFPTYPKSVLCIGELIDVGYLTVRDGKLERYRHQFAASARPLLTSSHDGRQLFILGGGYDFTERGIVDRKSRAR